MSVLVWCLSLVTWAADSEEAPSHQALLQRGLRAVERVAVVPPAPTVVLHNAVVWTGRDVRHETGFVVLKDGRIADVGAGEPPTVPDAVVVDVQRKHITPGIIDTHSHLGVYPSPRARAHEDGNEMTAPTTPGVWAEHSVWPQDPGLQRAIAGGVTTIQVLPGSANLIGGRGVVLRTVPARGSRAMRLPGAPETVKMACGENPKRVYGTREQAPSTRMGNVRGHRQAFLDAQAYMAERAEPDAKGKKKGEATPMPRNLDMETLVAILEGEALLQVHCYRADDMLSMLQIADEFGFSIRSFHHATEAYKIRDILAEKEVSASLWADWWGFKIEAYDAVVEGLAMVSEAGARAIVHSDSGIGIQRLNQEAAKSVYRAMAQGIDVDETDALRWLTSNPAWALGIEDQTGSLTEGLRADVVVWTGHPLSVYSRADWVFVDGHLRYDHARSDAVDPWSDFEIGQGVLL